MYGRYAVARRHLVAEAGEGRLIVGVDGSSLVLRAGSTATGSAATGTTAGTATATGTIAAGTTTGTATGTTTSGTLRLDVALLDLEDLLDLALTLALLLAGGAGDELLSLLLLDGLGVGPLLVLNDTLVGLADLESGLGLESGLLLGELGEVLGVGDVLLLLLLGGSLNGGLALSGGLLLLRLGDLLTSLLILQLSLALGGAPGLGSLLLGTARYGVSGRRSLWLEYV